MGKSLRDAGLFRASNDYYAKAARRPERREAILPLIGLNFLEVQDSKLAADAFEKCLKEFPKSPRRPEWTLNLARALALGGRRKRHGSCFSHCCANTPLLSKLRLRGRYSGRCNSGSFAPQPGPTLENSAPFRQKVIATGGSGGILGASRQKQRPAFLPLVGMPAEIKTPSNRRGFSGTRLSEDQLHSGLHNAWTGYRVDAAECRRIEGPCSDCPGWRGSGH